MTTEVHNVVHYGIRHECAEWHLVPRKILPEKADKVLTL